MKVLGSACLLGRKCKYNGGSNYNPAVAPFVADREVVEYCPEVMAGAFAENIASIRLMIKSGMKQPERRDELEYRGTVHQCVYDSVEKG